MPPSSPTAIPQTPADLARAVFGGRLIVQVVIPSLDLLAPVVPVGWSPQGADSSNPEVTWDSPEAQVGWVITSALPGGTGGVTLLYGHNNIQSSVFKRLYELKPGNEVKLVTGERTWLYRVSETHLLPVKGSEPADYAAFLRTGRLPRLVLISCWPPEGNSHRVIVVAELALR
jgi:LPXTG-site transpeptidase (sortase) family protein